MNVQIQNFNEHKVGQLKETTETSIIIKLPKAKDKENVINIKIRKQINLSLKKFSIKLSPLGKVLNTENSVHILI